MISEQHFLGQVGCWKSSFEARGKLCLEHECLRRVAQHMLANDHRAGNRPRKLAASISRVQILERRPWSRCLLESSKQQEIALR